jgi:hypothetical protein
MCFYVRSCFGALQGHTGDSSSQAYVTSNGGILRIQHLKSFKLGVCVAGPVCACTSGKVLNSPVQIWFGPVYTQLLPDDESPDLVDEIWNIEIEVKIEYWNLITNLVTSLFQKKNFATPLMIKSRVFETNLKHVFVTRFVQLSPPKIRSLVVREWNHFPSEICIAVTDCTTKKSN